MITLSVTAVNRTRVQGQAPGHPDRLRVYPAEEVYARRRREGDPHRLPPVVTELQAEARARGLWNLFLRDRRWRMRPSSPGE